MSENESPNYDEQDELGVPRRWVTKSGKESDESFHMRMDAYREKIKRGEIVQNIEYGADPAVAEQAKIAAETRLQTTKATINSVSAKLSETPPSLDGMGIDELIALKDSLMKRWRDKNSS